MTRMERWRGLLRQLQDAEDTGHRDRAFRLRGQLVAYRVEERRLFPGFSDMELSELYDSSGTVLIGFRYVEQDFSDSWQDRHPNAKMRNNIDHGAPVDRCSVADGHRIVAV